MKLIILVGVNDINLNKNVKTSGAYVLYRGLFIFQVGPTEVADNLGVVRLGGHKEFEETALETARREVFEESSMKITPINSPITYHMNEWGNKPSIIQLGEEIAPILVKGNEQALSIMYLSYSENEPNPSSETNGLLLLTPEDVLFICNNKITLNDFIKRNGKAILKGNINKDLFLIPFPQLLFLSKMLEEHPDLFIIK